MCKKMSVLCRVPVLQVVCSCHAEPSVESPIGSLRSDTREVQFVAKELFHRMVLIVFALNRID
jgi:hypothetical protein